MKKLLPNDSENEYLKRVIHKNRIDNDSFDAIERSRLAKFNLNDEITIHNETECSLFTKVFDEKKGFNA